MREHDPTTRDIAYFVTVVGIVLFSAGLLLAIGLGWRH